MVVESMPAERLEMMVAAYVFGSIDVVWTTSDDTDLGRWVAYILTENPENVAAVVMGEGRWPYQPWMFIHEDDKERFVRRVTEIVGLKNGGGRVV